MVTEEKKFKVYKSSAGSGKTYTLVLEFLRLCLIADDLYGFSRILAITFTNKATYEMKHRILAALKGISSGEEKSEGLKNTLAESTGLKPSEVKERCDKILTAILHSYADFGISTIDKFTHRLIRTFSKDLGLPPNFKVELDEAEVLQEVIDILIDSIGKDKRVTDLILKFAFVRIEEEKSWKIDKELVDFAKDTLKEKSKPYLKELKNLKEKDYKSTIKSFSELVSNFENGISNLAKEAMQLIESNGINPKSFAGRAKNSIYFRRMAALEMNYIMPSNEIFKNVDNGNWVVDKTKADEQIAIEGIQNSLEELFREIQKIREEQFTKYVSAQAVLKNIHSLSLLNYIEQKLEAFKKEERIIQISDFNDLIASVVEHEPMPFIYERLGDKYKHVMIDEFQDTSVKQFSNLLPLVEDSLARGNENLIVGDAKQAIYRFRGGEVGQFSEMPNYKLDEIEQNDLYDERILTLKSQYNDQFLTTNWRSLPNVVNFNSSFFDYAIAQPGLTPNIQKIYKSHGQTASQGKTDGLVTIEFVEGKLAEEKKEQYFEKLAQQIGDALDSGFTLSDIAILVRKNSHVKETAEYLKLIGIEVISSDALLIKNDIHVQFLLAISGWIFEPNSDLFRKNIIQYLTNVGLLKGDLAENLETYLNQNRFQTVFEDLNILFNINTLRLKSAHEFYENIIRLFGLDRNYNVYIQFFQDEVFDYFKSNKATIPQFLDWWYVNEDRLSISAESGIDAVNLLTIHKSKGLEFPVVIMPFANQEMTFSGGMIKKFIWTKNMELPATPLPYALVEYSKTLIDSEFRTAFEAEYEKSQIDLLNDVYVGFTRAVERMHIISEKKSGKNRGERDLNLCDLLEGYVHSNEVKELEEDYFIIGESTLRKDKEIKKEKEEVDLNYLSQAWNEKIKVANSARVQWKQDIRIQYGILLHELLGEINSKSMIDEVIQNQIGLGVFTDEDATFFCEKLDYLLEKESINKFFNADLKVKNEADLLDSNGKLLRPDKVVYFEDYIAVLDFKTGEKNEAHHEQVNEYVHALSDIEKEQQVKGFILYTETAELVEV